MTAEPKKKMTIPAFRDLKKQGRKVTMITVYDYPFARLVDRSRAEMILVGDSLGMVIQGLDHTNPVTLDEMIYHAKMVRRGAPNTLIVGDMPFMSYQVSPDQAVAAAGRMLKETGVDCVKMEGGEWLAPYVKRITDVGIPVMGHIGLTPQSASAMGGFKVQGRTKDQAEQLIADAKALDKAGAFSIVIECVPPGVTKAIHDSVDAAIISCGAGPHADGQNLNGYDILGLFEKFVPKFVKQWKNLAGEMIDGYNQMTDEVAGGTFPTPGHTFKGDEDVTKLYPTD